MNVINFNERFINYYKRFFPNGPLTVTDYTYYCSHSSYEESKICLYCQSSHTFFGGVRPSFTACAIMHCCYCYQLHCCWVFNVINAIFGLSLGLCITYCYSWPAIKRCPILTAEVGLGHNLILKTVPNVFPSCDQKYMCTLLTLFYACRKKNELFSNECHICNSLSAGLWRK